ncbi:unnamed protein product, partial [Urochloa humidicola]
EWVRKRIPTSDPQDRFLELVAARRQGGGAR